MEQAPTTEKLAPIQQMARVDRISGSARPRSPLRPPPSPRNFTVPSLSPSRPPVLPFLHTAYHRHIHFRAIIILYGLLGQLDIATRSRASLIILMNIYSSICLAALHCPIIPFGIRVLLINNLHEDKQTIYMATIINSLENCANKMLPSFLPFSPQYA
jgi:hypothetical protein